MTDSAQPFAAKKFLEIKGRRMAYIDEGEGAPIVFAHGNPTSSYLWRNVMPACRGLGRLIACDMIGMGAEVSVVIEESSVLIRERTVAGLKAARARGRKGGRSAKLSPKEIKTIRSLLKGSDIPVSEIAVRFGVARSTLYRSVVNSAAR